MEDEVALLRAQLADQARSCEVMGSPLYAGLLRRAAAEVGRRGVLRQLLVPRVRPGRGDALALRLLAAVHRLVLAGAAPELAAFYPSVGGTGAPAAAWPAFLAVLERRREELDGLLDQPCQTNEVGRAAALAFGFLDVAARAGLPLRLLEIGASAGLNLRWDRFRYGGGGAAWGPADSPVDLSGLWTDAPQQLVPVAILDRRGCDRRPLDPSTDEGRLRLRCSVWADQLDRLRRLDGALRLADQLPAAVEQAAAEAWVEEQLATPRPGALTVLYHSVVLEYLSLAARRRLVATIRRAGTRASAAAPLAWVCLEPASRVRQHGVTATLWPGGEDRRLAVCGAHGNDVRRVAP